MQSASFRERLWAPVSYWVIGMFFGLSVVVALGFYLGPWVALASLVATTALIAGGLLWYGSTAVVADTECLRVGDMRLPWRYVGAVAMHDSAATRRRMGPDADPRAMLVTRPYIPTSVEIELSDPDDPHPYWLVSSRHAQRLAAAIAAHAELGLSPDPAARQDEPESTKEK